MSACRFFPPEIDAPKSCTRQAAAVSRANNWFRLAVYTHTHTHFEHVTASPVLQKENPGQKWDQSPGPATACLSGRTKAGLFRWPGGPEISRNRKL